MFKSLFALAATVLFVGPAFAESASEISAPLPATISTPLRLAPVFGSSSFTQGGSVSTNNFRGFSAGLFADLGTGALNFETGILALGASQTHNDRSASVDVQNWGIPLLAKLNFSGNPNSTIFIKAGAMPFQTTSTDNNTFNVMGVGGIGAALPLGRNSSVLVDASYNRLFTNNGDLTDYQGLSLLAGLSFNL